MSLSCSPRPQCLTFCLPMSYTAYIVSLNTLDSSSLLSGALAVVGCGEPRTNSSVYFYFRPVRDLIPSGAHYMVSGDSWKGSHLEISFDRAVQGGWHSVPQPNCLPSHRLEGQVSSGGLPGKEYQVRDRGQVVAAGTHVTAGGYVCVCHRAELATASCLGSM